MTGLRKYIIVIAVSYAVMLVLLVAAMWYINENISDSERKLYLAFVLMGSYIYGKVAHWFIRRVFNIDITKKYSDDT